MHGNIDHRPDQVNAFTNARELIIIQLENRAQLANPLAKVADGIRDALTVPADNTPAEIARAAGCLTGVTQFVERHPSHHALLKPLLEKTLHTVETLDGRARQTRMRFRGHTPLLWDTLPALTALAKRLGTETHDLATRLSALTDRVLTKAALEVGEGTTPRTMAGAASLFNFPLQPKTLFTQTRDEGFDRLRRLDTATDAAAIKDIINDAQTVPHNANPATIARAAGTLAGLWQYANNEDDRGEYGQSMSPFLVKAIDTLFNLEDLPKSLRRAYFEHPTDLWALIPRLADDFENNFFLGDKEIGQARALHTIYNRVFLDTMMEPAAAAPEAPRPGARAGIITPLQSVAMLSDRYDFSYAAAAMVHALKEEASPEARLRQVRNAATQPVMSDRVTLGAVIGAAGRLEGIAVFAALHPDRVGPDFVAALEAKRTSATDTLKTGQFGRRARRLFGALTKLAL